MFNSEELSMFSQKLNNLSDVSDLKEDVQITPSGESPKIEKIVKCENSKHNQDSSDSKCQWWT